jgi:CheY-like chemotaxis protein
MFGNRYILIVEDEPLIAATLAFAVEDAGGLVVGPVASVCEAMALLAPQGLCPCEIAAAILDANLLDGEITPVALALAAAHIPFVLFTGTGAPADLARLAPATPVVMKPAIMPVVLDRLCDAMIDAEVRGTA